MKKSYKNIIMLLVALFIGIVNIKALPNSIGPIDQSGGKLTLNKEDTLALKYYDSTAVFCTEFHKTTPATGRTCTLTDTWKDKKINAGVASIIEKVGVVPVNGSTVTNYYYGELAINEFLCNSGIETSVTCVSSTRDTKEVLGDFYSWYTGAIAIRDSYVGTANITLNTSTLTFTKNGENYVSNTVTVTKNLDTDYTVTTSIGNVVKNGNSFYISIPASSVKSGETTNVNVNVSISKTYSLAQNYDCGSGYQTVTPNILESHTIKDTATASGNITTTKLIINKVDSDNNHLSGATILVKGTKGYSKTFVTAGKSIVIENLEYDTYTITETKSPDGYVLSQEKKVTLSGTNLTSTVTITNIKNKVQISKLDATEKKELPGATLEIQDKNGKTLYKWVSTTTPYEIEGLAVGKYTLIETIAPMGYTLSTEKVVLEITEKTTIEKVTMKNKLNKVSILKISAENKKALAGATLEIQDKEGNVVKYCVDKKGNKNTECKWISTEKAYEIEGLPVGKYYLVETIAPEGYELNKEKKEFEVTAKTPVLKVEMENHLEVKVPDTLDSRSALLLAIAMFDIALGIGIVTYVKKNKTEE